MRTSQTRLLVPLRFTGVLGYAELRLVLPLTGGEVQRCELRALSQMQSELRRTSHAQNGSRGRSAQFRLMAASGLSDSLTSSSFGHHSGRSISVMRSRMN